MVDTISDPSYPSSYVNDSVQETVIVSRSIYIMDRARLRTIRALNDESNSDITIKIHRFIDCSACTQPPNRTPVRINSCKNRN